MSKGSSTNINATVRDNCFNTITGATVSASFNNGDPTVPLYDDGAHSDGAADDGVYANTWTPINSGSCTILLTALKTGLSDGSETVSGTVSFNRYVKKGGTDIGDCTSSSSPCKTIQYAINISESGDSIRVAEGMYYENISVMSSISDLLIQGGWNQTLTSHLDNPLLTIIDGDASGDGVGDGSVISVNAGTGEIITATIENFTITNGYSSSGGGLQINSSNAGTVQMNLLNNIIVDNVAPFGGGIYADASGEGVIAIMLTNNMVVENSANSGGGIYATSAATGSSIYLKLLNDTITANSSVYGSGLDLVAKDSGITFANAKNEIIWGNSATATDDDIYLYQENATTLLKTSFSDVGNVVNDLTYPGKYIGDSTDISEDPLFKDPAARDYHLTEFSSCIDKGTNVGAPLNDFEGDPRPINGDGDAVAITDMGADEYYITVLPDIKANGSDGPVIITQSDILSITIELSSGSHSGKNADWWVLALTPMGLYHYDFISDFWMPGPVVTYQGPLFDMSPYEILNMSGLPAGLYHIFFAVDLVMNGLLDLEQVYYDYVDVDVRP